jgi:hypothetical protein
MSSDATVCVVVELISLGQREAAALAARQLESAERWADGFPREDDVEPCAALAAASDRANIASQRVLEKNGFRRSSVAHDLVHFTLWLASASPS